MENDVRLALYDSLGKLVGYKTDSCWSLSSKESCSKHHSREDSEYTSHLFDNLLYLLNWDPSVIPEKMKNSGFTHDSKGSLYIVAEDLSSGKGLSGVGLSLGEDGKYIISCRL